MAITKPGPNKTHFYRAKATIKSFIPDTETLLYIDECLNVSSLGIVKPWGLVAPQCIVRS